MNFNRAKKMISNILWFLFEMSTSLVVLCMIFFHCNTCIVDIGSKEKCEINREIWKFENTYIGHWRWYFVYSLGIFGFNSIFKCVPSLAFFLRRSIDSRMVLWNSSSVRPFTIGWHLELKMHKFRFMDLLLSSIKFNKIS